MYTENVSLSKHLLTGLVKSERPTAGRGGQAEIKNSRKESRELEILQQDTGIQYGEEVMIHMAEHRLKETG